MTTAILSWPGIHPWHESIPTQRLCLAQQELNVEELFRFNHVAPATPAMTGGPLSERPGWG
jgi:hypothetical protein